MTLIDNNAGEEVDRTAIFYVEADEGPRDFLALYEDTIRQHLEVTVQSVEVVDGLVEVAYVSQYPIDSSEGHFEIGFLAGAFAGFIDEGWEVDGLEATVTDGEGDRYRFGVDREVARDWFEGELTDEEFTDIVLDSLEPMGTAS